MESLKARVRQLRVNPEKLISFWLHDDSFQGRVDSRGEFSKPADIITCVALAQTAIRFLPADNALRAKTLQICKKSLLDVQADGCPWTLPGETDASAAAFTTGRVLLDLGKGAELVASNDLIKRSLASLHSWLQTALSRHNNPVELPLIHRAAAVLKDHNHVSASDLAPVGNYAQALIHQFISYHTLGRQSQFDTTLLCLALTTDNTFASNPLPLHERGKCLDIALKDEPLITRSRSTVTRLGNSAAGCSALDVLSWMLANEYLASALISHSGQLDLTLAWLEDHSSTVKSLRVFQSDLFPDWFNFDAWFNCLVLFFLDDLDNCLNQHTQIRLRRELSAAEVNTKFPLKAAVCGGYNWPAWLKTDFLERVGKEGRIPSDLGNGIALFGPPGTGKTTLAKSITQELPGWRFVELSTADFLLDGYENLFRSIRKIFKDLRQLEKCVIFFDELELLIMERDPEKAAWATSIITNVMLPELQHLHDCDTLIPIFATNHISRFDPAGRRPGRFDFILPVGLPSPAERLKLLQKQLPGNYIYPEIETLSEGSTIRELLEWARQYKNAGKPGKVGAEEVWNSGFNKLRVAEDALREFGNDIENFAFPPRASVKV